MRGAPALNDPRFDWRLPTSPFSTQCGYLDRDGDGLLDWAETELAWAFRPYLVFDNAEGQAGNDTYENINGLTLLYQIHPLTESLDGETISDQSTKLLRLQVVLTFRRDLAHDGDTENYYVELVSRDSGFQTWSIHYLQWRRCKMTEGSLTEERHNRRYCGTFACDGRVRSILLAEGKTQEGVPCGDSSDFCLPVIHVSKGKHGLYVSKSNCEGCVHGESIEEECDGGWSGPACYGLPGAFKLSQGVTPPGFMTPTAFYAFKDVTDPQLIRHNQMYLGNVGELQFASRNQVWRRVMGVYLGAAPNDSASSVDEIILEPSEGASNFPIPIIKYWMCHGSEAEIEAAIPPALEQTYLDLQNQGWSLDPNYHHNGTNLVDPRFLHYPTRSPFDWPSGTCMPLNEEELGESRILGSLDPVHVLAQPSDFWPYYLPRGTIGQYANYPHEGVFDTLHADFCGGNHSSPEKNCDAQLLRKIFSRLPWELNASQSCIDRGLSFMNDSDQDGAPDDFDCDPLHPYLHWDVDQDGHCDLPVLQGDMTICQQICTELYSVASHGNALGECVLRCQGPHDNCSPLVNRFGSPYGAESESGQCQSLTSWYDDAVLFRCRQWFQNADQADLNGNGIGDRCERGITDLRVEVRPETFGMNRGYFSWCPDPTATVSAFLSRDSSFLTGGMLSVGLCACPGQTEASCRDDSTEPKTLYCPSDPVEDDVSGEDYSMKDFAWDSESQNFKYFYHPLEAPTPRDLGVLTSNSTLRGEVRQGTSVPDQGLLARWRDVLFENVRVFLTFRTDRFREFPGFSTATMLETFPSEAVVPTHDRYSKLKFSSPQILEQDAIDNPWHPVRLPTHETWNPEAPTAEYTLFHAPPGTFYFNPEEDDVCVRFPRPVGQPVGYAEGSPLPVDPLWDPPRDLLDPLFGWITDENGAWRLFGVDPASFQVRTYVALPSGLDLRETELRFLRVDAALVGGDPGVWSTVAAALDRSTLVLRDPLQTGEWTQVPTQLPANQTILAFHQATSDSLWVIMRKNLFTAPVLFEVHLSSGAVLRQQPLPDWTFVRVESMAAPRMGEAYFLLRRPAHLLPNLWKLDRDGLRPDLALPALVPPDRGALAVDGRMGKVYLVARAATDRKTSLWVHDLVTKDWTRLSSAVPVSVPREPRLALSGERLVFSDLKDGRWWEWTQGRWVELGNPLTREVGP